MLTEKRFDTSGHGASWSYAAGWPRRRSSSFETSSIKRWNAYVGNEFDGTNNGTLDLPTTGPAVPTFGKLAGG